MDNSCYQFKNTFYEQIFGIPMGPISGLFVDIVMDEVESECFKKLTFSPTFYFRFVDDLFTCTC